MTTTKPLMKLVEKAREGQARSFSPYSRFAVGAALETFTGEVFIGCNIESSSYGLTICAERVALFKAISEGFSNFSRIAVVADCDDFCPPCGACRQLLVDFAPNIEIILVNVKNEIKKTNIANLLPEAFNSDYLTKRRHTRPG